MIKECPKCKSSKVYTVDSRPSKSEIGTLVIRRRKNCRACKWRWTTYELTADEYQQMRSENTKLAYQLVQQFKEQIEKWLVNHDPNSNVNISGIKKIKI